MAPTPWRSIGPTRMWPAAGPTAAVPAGLVCRSRPCSARRCWIAARNAVSRCWVAARSSWLFMLPSPRPSNGLLRRLMAPMRAAVWSMVTALSCLSKRRGSFAQVNSSPRSCGLSSLLSLIRTFRSPLVTETASEETPAPMNKGRITRVGRNRSNGGPLTLPRWGRLPCCHDLQSR